MTAQNIRDLNGRFHKFKWRSLIVNHGLTIYLMFTFINKNLTLSTQFMVLGSTCIETFSLVWPIKRSYEVRGKVMFSLCPSIVGGGMLQSGVFPRGAQVRGIPWTG